MPDGAATPARHYTKPDRSTASMSPSGPSSSSSQSKKGSSCISSITAALLAQGPFKESPSDQQRKAKCSAIASWLMNVACTAGREDLHDKICDIAEALDLGDDVVCADFEVRSSLTPRAKAAVRIPQYISELNNGAGSCGAALIVQASVRGAGCFFANDACAASYVSAKEAEAVYAETPQDPDSVLRRLVAPRDRRAYLAALTELLVKQPGLQAETSLHCSVRQRGSPQVLVPCLVQLRCSFSPDGNAVALACKFTPEPQNATPRADLFMYNLGKALHVDLGDDGDGEIEENNEASSEEGLPPSPTKSHRKGQQEFDRQDSAGTTESPVRAYLGTPQSNSFDLAKAYMEKHSRQGGVPEEPSSAPLAVSRRKPPRRPAPRRNPADVN